MSPLDFLRIILVECYMILFQELDGIIQESRRAKNEMDRIQMMQYLDAESFDYEDWR